MNTPYHFTELANAFTMYMMSSDLTFGHDIHDHLTWKGLFEGFKSHFDPHFVERLLTQEH